MGKLESQIAKTLLPGMQMPPALAKLFCWIEAQKLYIDRDSGARLGFLGEDRKESVGTDIAFAAEGNVNLKYWFGLADELARALEPLSAHIRVAFVFGSMAGGSQREGSDIDIVVLGDADFGTIVDALYPLQKLLGREINAKVFAVSEWNAKVKARSAFTTDVLRKPKVFLVGNEDELAGLGRKEPRAHRSKR